jgi:integrase
MPKSSRPAVVLTDAKVKALKHDPAGEYIQGDLIAQGFGVRVRPAGDPVYVLVKRRPGETKPTRVTIGKVRDITLAEARQHATEAATAIRRGVDVNAEKRATRKPRPVGEDEAPAPGSFGALADVFIARECPKLARGEELAAIIRRTLLPSWRDRPLGELRRRDLTAILDPVIASGRTQAAHKLREVAIRVMNLGVERDDIEVNALLSPSRGRRRSGFIQRTKRSRVLDDGELRDIWRASDAVGEPFSTIVRLLITTGQRRGEVAGMEWRELDLASGGIWVIPANRYKTDVEHVVPLPNIAVALLSGIPKTDARFVFSTKPGSRFSGFSKSMARLRDLSGIADWRLHDIRRTVRTGMARLRIDPDVAERVVGHVIGGVRGVYDRHAYLEEKQDALDRWAMHLSSIVAPDPDRVVRLRG